MKRTKIAFIGAGSVVFSKNVVADILWHDALKNVELVLVDIDRDRLATAEAMCRSFDRQLGAGARISSTLDRRTALDGADFVINAIGVGGFEATKIDLLLPAKFGVKQTIGDTMGVGGVFRAVRAVPVLLQICREMQELCPNALLINYSNPMAMHVLAVARATRVRCVGLCHGVQNTAQNMRMIVAMMEESPAVIWRHFRRRWGSPERDREWKEWLRKGLDPELSFTCAGINHMAFFLRFTSRGRDLYPLLRKAAEMPHTFRLDPVRFELFKRLGYFMTETSSHTSEYVPYFLKSDAEVKRCHLRISSYVGACRELNKLYRTMRRSVFAGKPVIDLPYHPSNEYASRILNAIITGQPYVFNGNVHNRGGALINNLPADSCVEVPCVANRQGIHPTSIGDLPPQCAALIRTNINVQDLAVRGILDGDRRAIHQAVMLDPNTASQLSLSEMDRLVEAMFKAHVKLLPKNLR